MVNIASLDVELFRGYKELFIKNQNTVTVSRVVSIDLTPNLDIWDYLGKYGIVPYLTDRYGNPIYYYFDYLDFDLERGRLWIGVSNISPNEERLYQLRIANINPYKDYFNPHQVASIQPPTNIEDFEGDISYLSLTSDVLVDNTINHTPLGNKSLKILGGTSTEEKAIVRLNYPSSGLVYHVRWFRVDAQCQGHLVAMKDVDSGSWVGAHVTLGKTGVSPPTNTNTICYFVNGWVCTDFKVNINKWYLLMVVIDLTNSNYDIYVGDESSVSLIASDVGFINGKSPAGLTVDIELGHTNNQQGNTSNLWIDDCVDAWVKDSNLLSSFGELIRTNKCCYELF